MADDSVNRKLNELNSNDDLKAGKPTIPVRNLLQEAWKLLNKEVNFQILLHGAGHNTTAPVREYSYDWIRRNYE